jgi:superfamily II DNA or RNA helicase
VRQKPLPSKVFPLRLCFDDLAISEVDNLACVALDSGNLAVPMRTTVHNFDLATSGVLFDLELLQAGDVSEVTVELSASLLDIDEIVGELPLTSSTFLYDFETEQQTVVNTYPIAFPHVRIFGMSYADKYWQEFPNVEDKADEKPKAVPRNGKIPSEQRKNKRKGKANAPQTTFWDLIYVLLKPPLTLGDTSSLYLPHPLFPYQITGVNFLMNGESSLLADDMGTGKTVMTLVALRVLAQQAKIRRILIVCPPSVLYEWKRHLQEWTPDLVPLFVRGTRPQRAIDWGSDAHVYITTYDTLRGDMENGTFPTNKLDMFDVVVLDEAHHIKNPASGRSRAVKKLKARQRWALTGTPIQNRVEDLLSLFDFLRPGLFANATPYPSLVIERIKPYFLRRRKQEVMPELPPKQRQEFWLDLDHDQRRIYDQLELRIQTEIAAIGANVSKTQIYTSVNKLKQVCNFAPGKASSPKISALKEQIEEIIDSGNKVIVFTQFIGEGVDKIEAALRAYGVARIVGGQSDSERTSEIERFKKRSTTNILIASVRAGGEGLNLVEASYVVHFDHWWNPAVMWQAEDRAHRRGQKVSVNVYSYWMTDTIDQRIHDILEKKKILFQELVDDLAVEKLEAAITTEEWLGILGIPVKQKQPSVQPQPLTSASNLTVIRDRLLAIDPSRFEQLTSNLMQRLGLQNARVVGRSGDGGLDVLATRNTEQGIEYIAAQCKRWRGDVGVSIARELLGAMEDKNIHVGYLIVAGDFTADCLHFCQKHNIHTISGLEFARYIEQFGLLL